MINSTYCWDHFFFHFLYNKTIIRFNFCNIQNNQGLGKGYQPSDDYSGYHKNFIQ